jgi:hypothetical protein
VVQNVKFGGKKKKRIKKKKETFEELTGSTGASKCDH